MRPEMVVATEPLVAHGTMVWFLASVDQTMSLQMLDPAKRPVAALAFMLLFIGMRPDVLAQFALAHPFTTLRAAGHLRIGWLQVGLGKH